MSTIVCNWQEFKERSRDFFLAAPTLDLDELDNAFKCLGLSYLGMNEPMWINSAATVMRLAANKYMERELELRMDNVNDV